MFRMISSQDFLFYVQWRSFPAFLRGSPRPLLSTSSHRLYPELRRCFAEREGMVSEHVDVRDFHIVLCLPGDRFLVAFVLRYGYCFPV